MIKSRINLIRKAYQIADSSLIGIKNIGLFEATLSVSEILDFYVKHTLS